MNDLVLNLLPIGGNLQRGPTVSSGMNRSMFNSVDFCSGRYLREFPIPQFFGAPPNGGGGWSGSGILGTYYSNNNYTGTSFQRTDVRIDMPPTTVLPGGSLATDPVYGAVGATNFSVKWVGSLIPKYTQTYALRVKTGGTLTLKIGGSTVVTATASDGWVSAGYNFTAGGTYSVEVDMVQGTGPWAAQVHWSGTGPVPFPEEAIGPATPIGVNLTNFLDDKNSTANGGLFSAYKDHLGGSTGPAIDSSGWPTGDFAFDQMSIPNNGTGPYSFPHGFSSDAKTGVWTVSFNGAAELYTNNTGQFLIGHNDGSRTPVTLNTLTYYNYNQDMPASALTWDSTTGTGYNPTTNTTVALFDLRGGGWDNVGFKNTDRSGKGAPGGPSGSPSLNGLTNVVCMRPKTVGSTTSYAVGTALHDPFLTMLAPYTAVRELASAYDLDFVASVTSPATDWANRPTPSFNINASNKNQYPNVVTPWEVRVMLANQAGKDLYINLPQTASGNASDSNYSSSYIYQLASLIKNGGTSGGVSYPGLLPHLCVYIEYGNENWNFSLHGPYGSRGDVVWDTYFHEQANTKDWQQYSAMGGWVTLSGTPPNVNTDTETLWTALKAKDSSDLFRIVFGDAAMPGGPAGLNPDPRIRPLFEWQYKGDWNGEGYDSSTALATIQSYFGTAPNLVYWGGGGGWYADYSPSGSTADQVFSNITLATGGLPPTNVTGETNQIQTDMDRLARYGLHHVGYEGGFDFGLQSATNAQQQASDDVRIKPYVKQAVDQYFQAGGALPIVFQADGGPYGFGQGWSVIDGIWDQPPYATAPPKLQAYLDAEAVLPAVPVAPAAWVTAPANFPVQVGRNTSRPPQFQTFVISNPGYYSVGFTTDPTIPGPTTGDIVATLDGTTILSVTTTNAGAAQAYWTLVYLGASVHSLVIAVTRFTDTSKQIGFSPWGVR